MEATDVVDEQVQEVITPEDQEAPAEAKPVEESYQDRNWKEARSRLEEQSRHINEQSRMMAQMSQELEELRKQKVPDEEEEYLTESEKKLNRKIKDLEKKLDQSSQMKRSMTMEEANEALQEKFADFDEVLAPENLEYLKKNNRALFKAIVSLKDDPYEQGMAAYEALKNTRYYQERATMADKEKVAENSKKPISTQSIRKQGPLSEANKFAAGLTPELKKVLLQEMRDAAKRA